MNSFDGNSLVCQLCAGRRDLIEASRFESIVFEPIGSNAIANTHIAKSIAKCVPFSAHFQVVTKTSDDASWFISIFDPCSIYLRFVSLTSRTNVILTVGFCIRRMGSTAIGAIDTNTCITTHPNMKCKSKVIYILRANSHRLPTLISTLSSCHLNVYTFVGKQSYSVDAHHRFVYQKFNFRRQNVHSIWPIWFTFVNTMH